MKKRSKDRDRQNYNGSRVTAPLPRDTVQILNSNRTEIDNLNLLFNRFVWRWTAADRKGRWELKDQEKTHFLESDFLSNATKVNAKHDALKAYKARLRASLQSMHEFGLTIEQLEISTLWRLAVGMGYKGSMEIGITLHHIYGFPYIPATAVKGLTRAWAELVEKADKATVGRIFGSETKDEKAADSNQLGSVLFFDAVPVEWPQMEVDIMNPHYPDYYRDPKNNPPGDWQNPVPIQFLAVAPRTKFWFGLASKSAEDLSRAKQWLVSGLKELGIGAKTSAGYGYFSERPTMTEVTQPSTTSRESQQIALPNSTMKTVQQQPAGTVKAEIIDDRAKPPKVKILEGKFAQQETILPRVELQNLGLFTGSIVYVKIVDRKGILEKAEYAGKPS